MSRSYYLRILSFLVAGALLLAVAGPAKGPRVQDWDQVIPRDEAETFDFPFLPLDRTLRALDQVTCMNWTSTEGVYQPGNGFRAPWGEQFDRATSDESAEAAIERARQELERNRITIYHIHDGCCGANPCTHALASETGSYNIETTSNRLNMWAWIADGPSYDSVDDILGDVDDLVNWLFAPDWMGRDLFPEVIIDSWTQNVTWDYDTAPNCTGHVYATCDTKLIVGTASFRLHRPNNYGWLSGEVGNITPQQGLGKDVGDRGYPVGRLANWFMLTNADISTKDCDPCPPPETAMGYIPSGGNYGDIGDGFCINDGGVPVAFTIPDGSWMHSDDPNHQDMLVTDVPTREGNECSGAEALDVAITVPPETVVVVKDLPGVCPDYEKDPPTAGDSAHYELQPPNDKSRALVAVVDEVAAIDFTAKPLKGMKPGQAAETACQGAVWMAESRIDEVEGNEVSTEELHGRFFMTYLAAVDPAHRELDDEERDQLDDAVRDDLTTIVNAIDFATKPRAI